MELLRDLWDAVRVDRDRCDVLCECGQRFFSVEAYDEHRRESCPEHTAKGQLTKRRLAEIHAAKFDA